MSRNTGYFMKFFYFVLLVKCLVTHIAERFFRDLTAPGIDAILLCEFESDKI